MVHEEVPQAWWFDNHNLAKPSPWLGNTLSELDGNTKQMLKLIEQDADSFAQRAEMYYKKRPVLVDMLGDLYRAHRSLAEQYDLLKHGSRNQEAELMRAEITRLKDQNSELQMVIEENATALKEVLEEMWEATIVEEENFTLRECISGSKQHSPSPPSSSSGFDFKKKLTKHLLSAFRTGGSCDFCSWKIMLVEVVIFSLVSGVV